CIERTEKTYRTIAVPGYRFLAGTGTGGYLSYAIWLNEPELFGGVASICGTFSAENNPWYETIGSVYDQIESMHVRSPEVLSSIYTYLDAPADDPETDLPGSTDDIGRRLIAYRLSSKVHEFTVRPGQRDDTFLRESANRLAHRLTDYLLRDAIRGEVHLSRGSITAGSSVSASSSTQCFEPLRAFSDTSLSGFLCIDVTRQDGTQIESHRTGFDAANAETAFDCPLSLEAVTDAASPLSVSLSAEWGGKRFLLDEAVLVITDNSANDDYLPLDGDWHFNYTGRGQMDISSISKNTFETWPVVQPGLGNWTNGFGNISEKNVGASFGPDAFDFFITGNGYYARTFTLPETFNSDGCVLSVGYVDDRCEVWLNGRRIGETGMTDGRSNGQSTWASYSAFSLSADVLSPGENTVIVRCFNDLPSGVGGWYEGPVALYSGAAFEKLHGAHADPRFYEETFPSVYASGGSDAVDVPYLIYLPEGYDSTLRSYPTVYLLHQFNSDHTSYRRDHVREMLDAGIASGAFDGMIVVIPNSSENSWWQGAWEKMVTDELIPTIDARYRTIQDCRWRLTAGCSMGGQGAFGIALRNPNLFSGIVSFYGAFSYGGQANPNIIAARESADYLRHFAMYFICGNQDDYGFGMPAIDLHQSLKMKDVPHRFFIENGTHSSAFYTPYFEDAFSYIRSAMTDSHGFPDDVIHGSIKLTDTPSLMLETAQELESLMAHIPDSSYTKQADPDLIARLYLTLTTETETRILLDLPSVSLTPGMQFTLPLPEDLLSGSLPAGHLQLNLAVFDLCLMLDERPWPGNP
ncbi:MAG: hypothetical protein IJT77_01360, partial [Clostridia bacterium]|nr:hypothetical protein [Clostridia bacterium]